MPKFNGEKPGAIDGWMKLFVAGLYQMDPTIARMFKKGTVDVYTGDNWVQRTIVENAGQIAQTLKQSTTPPNLWFGILTQELEKIKPDCTDVEVEFTNGAQIMRLVVPRMQLNCVCVRFGSGPVVQASAAIQSNGFDTRAERAEVPRP